MPSTVAVAEAVLSPWVASVGATVAVFVNVPDAVGVTTMFTVTLAPPGRLPMAQIIVEADWREQGAIAETNVTAAGKLSVMTTPPAARLPTFVTVTLNVRLTLRGMEAGVAVVMSVKSVTLAIVTVLEAVLLAVLGSGSLAVTLAVLITDPLVPLTLTTIEMSTLAPLGIAPSEQTTGAGPEQTPWLALAETKASPVGSGAVTTTPVAIPCSLFVLVTDRL